ncbi:cerebellin 11 isoform X4 [Sinocyclocheilus grahami]|uniref:cerebellin 11 isoform X3 n=1 Tax=Sinocyclocheilus grahami TaxID=75366 RepID=UPI0007AD151E|nr:PREDICTED: complement C1q-like protein 4 isoform X3 [Sinocyclocheilus grahami]XP_016107582.1 PREDICTED: complement C1q-like protein 4 isoform X4 [Sinocyclocheilus grahami]
MALFQLFLISILSSCMAHDEDIMTPVVNIYSELKELKASIIGLTLALHTAKNELAEQKSLIQELQKQIKESPKVAFTASMSNTEDTHRGPFSTETKLIFDKVLTNIGNAYNPATGVFTAPVKGVYYFRYSGSAFSSHEMGLSIFKGTVRFVSSYEYNSGERNDQMSNGAVMELDVGEEVHTRLWIRTWIFVDPRYNYSTFTGYLLYPLDSTSV